MSRKCPKAVCEYLEPRHFCLDLTKTHPLAKIREISDEVWYKARTCTLDVTFHRGQLGDIQAQLLPQGTYHVAKFSIPASIGHDKEVFVVSAIDMDEGRSALLLEHFVVRLPITDEDDRLFSVWRATGEPVEDEKAFADEERAVTRQWVSLE